MQALSERFLWSRVGCARSAGQLGNSGITTVVVLLILLVLTIIAIAGMTVSTTEIRISGNQYRAGQGFHAADAGWRVAQPQVVSQAAGQNFNPGDFLTLNPPVRGILDSGVDSALVSGTRYEVLQARTSTQGAYFGKVRGFDVEYQFLDFTIPSTGTGPASTLAAPDSSIQRRVEVVQPVMGFWTQSYDLP